MDENDHSCQTLHTPSLSPLSTTSLPGLDLSRLPPIAILSAHLKDGEERTLKETLRQYNAPFSTEISRVKLFIGKVGTKRRAEFELRSRKLVVEEAASPKRPASPVKASARTGKRQKAGPSWPGSPNEGDSTEEEDTGNAETEDEVSVIGQGTPLSSLEVDASTMPIFETSSDHDFVWVVRLEWLQICVSQGHLVPLGEHLVYKGNVLERPKNTRSIKSFFNTAASATSAPQVSHANRPHAVLALLDRAKSDAPTLVLKEPYQSQHSINSRSHRFDGKAFVFSAKQSYATETANLLQQTTSEYEGVDSEFPQPPEWVTKGLRYACQRLTPANSPNEDFIEQLKKIRTARTLLDDNIGVRAYSTIIASIAAYPRRLSHPRELAQLPGCDEKTATLFVEWKNTGRLQAVKDYESDEAMKVLRSFYDIWGVGAKTARQFYYYNHWTELDDIIEFGWGQLDRVQQIGVKYYDEFLVPIPRPEVEQIASVVKEHVVRLRDERAMITIVGGYRRGKAASGDVDIVVSHPDLESTAGLIQDIVESLEQAEWITHVLTMSLTNTSRGQQPLPFRSTKGTGVGFDTLDKALVVWQDPAWPTRDHDLAKDPRAKNPAIHRRVDIIIAPWRTVGCAVMGWSGGTTFQRDLRRYAKAIKGWKFDSSGIRSRLTGEVVLLEGEDGVQGTPEDAEKAVFEGLGLDFIPPECRVTF